MTTDDDWFVLAAAREEVYLFIKERGEYFEFICPVAATRADDDRLQAQIENNPGGGTE